MSIWMVALLVLAGASCYAPDMAIQCQSPNSDSVYFCGIGQRCDGDGGCATIGGCTQSNPNACGTSCMKCTTSDSNAVPVCKAGVCGFECKPGACFGGGVCKSMMADDPMNCGACGRTCGSGQCKSGVCLPEVIAGKQSVPTSLALGTDGSIYWLESAVAGTINQLKPNETVPTTIYTASGVYVPFALSVDVQAVYWLERNQQIASLGRIMRQKHTDIKPGIFVDGMNVPYGIVAPGDGFVYWTTTGDGSVRRIARDGGAQQPVAAVIDKEIHGLTLINSWVLWANNGLGEVQEAEAMGMAMTAPAKVSTSVKPESIIHAPDGNVYWTEADTNRSIMRYSPGDKQVKTFVPNQNVPFGIAADATHLYWTERGQGTNGTVNRIKLDGSETTPTTLARDQASPNSVAVGDKYVYWTTTIPNGQVLRVAK
jgi:hypothetical protein